MSKLALMNAFRLTVGASLVALGAVAQAQPTFGNPSPTAGTETSQKANAAADQAIYQPVVYTNAAKKGPGSVRQRVNLVKRLLHGNRLFVSANCVGTVDWLRNLKKGKRTTEVVQLGIDCRHAFDSASYAISQEIPIEMEIRELPSISRIDEVVQI